MTLEWVRLYRDERGTFAQLPLFTRAFAAQLLKLTNDEGVIEIGRKDPADAVCFALGAEPNERRAVRRHMELLLADGYVVHDTERQRLVLPGFPRFQGHTLQRSEERPPRAQRASTETPTSAQSAPNTTPTSNRGASGVHPTRAQPAPNVLPVGHKSPESHAGTEPALKDQSREEENRKEVEVERASAPTTRPHSRFDVMAYHALHPVVLAARETWQAEYSRAFGKPYVARGHGDALAVARLAHWCELHAESTPGAIATEVARRVVRHFVAAKHCAGGTPPAQTWLDPDGVNYPLDPAAYLDPPVARPVRRGGRGAPTGMLPVSTDFGPAPEESDIATLFA